MRHPTTAALLVAAALLPACGGGSTVATSPLTIATSPAMTGTLVPFDNVFADLQVGAWENGPQRRTFLAFDLSQIPDGAVVTKATLRFVQTGTVGMPELAFSDFVVAHVDLGTSLTFAEDYGAPVFGSGQKLGNGGPSDGPFEHDVTSWVQADLAHPRPFASFRLTLETQPNPPPGDHYVTIDDPNSLSYAGPATLTVTWTTP